MTEFDAEAYNAASNMFAKAAMVRNSLPSLIAQIEDSVSMLGSPVIDGMPKQRGGGNKTEDRMVRHADVMSRMKEKQREYEQTLEDCESVVEAMEMDFDDNGAFLRYCFMQGKSKSESARLCGYVREYGTEKSEIAIVHAAKYVRKLGLVLRYS